MRAVYVCMYVCMYVCNTYVYVRVWVGGHVLDAILCMCVRDVKRHVVMKCDMWNAYLYVCAYFYLTYVLYVYVCACVACMHACVYACMYVCQYERVRAM